MQSTLGTVIRWIKMGLVKKYNSHQLCKKFKVEKGVVINI